MPSKYDCNPDFGEHYAFPDGRDNPCDHSWACVLYIMSKSIEHGRKAGIVSFLGISIGGLVHVLAAAIGVSAIILASSTAFSILKYLGALYLVYLGLKKIANKSGAPEPKEIRTKQRLSKIFYEGILVNALNPKTTIFFLAFLPQLINPAAGGITSQIIFLGMLFILVAVLSDLLYVALSSKIAFRIRRSKTSGRIQRYIIGSIYIVLGLMTLTINEPSGHRQNRYFCL